tara:strand:- start:248 stop:649 length:402 start_codon:yes stop_codon:yes gene_type:complete
MNYDTLNFYRRECYGNYLLLKETEVEYHPKEVRLLNNSFRTCLKKVIKETNKLLHNLEDVEIYPEDVATFKVMVPEILKSEDDYHAYLYLIPIQEAARGKHIMCQKAEKVQLTFFKRKFEEIQEQVNKVAKDK